MSVVPSVGKPTNHKEYEYDFDLPKLQRSGMQEDRWFHLDRTSHRHRCLGILAAVVIFALVHHWQEPVASFRLTAQRFRRLCCVQCAESTFLRTWLVRGAPRSCHRHPAYGSTQPRRLHGVLRNRRRHHYTTTATNLIGTIAIGTPTTTATPPLRSAIEGLLSTSASTYQGPYVQCGPITLHTMATYWWVQTGVATATPLFKLLDRSTVHRDW